MRSALLAINVIKEKRCGKVKGRTVADGRKQRALHAKDETTSPTASTDALMLSTMIDACEERDVATADVAGACLHAEPDDFTLLKLEGDSVDIMCNASEHHKEFVMCKKGKKALCLRLLKASCGCVQSALLWHAVLRHFGRDGFRDQSLRHVRGKQGRQRKAMYYRMVRRRQQNITRRSDRGH